MNAITNEYQELLNLYKQQENALLKQQKQLFWARTLSFLALFACLIGLLPHFFVIASIAAFICFILFVFSVRLNFKNSKKRAFIQELIKINENELKALKGDFSSFSNGEEFQNSDHPYTFDLDFFAEGGLFQYLNRTGTQPGKKKLANWISIPSLDKQQILKRQNTLLELESHTSWRQKFQASGNKHEEEDLRLLENMRDPGFKKIKKLRAVIYVCTALSLSALLLLLTGLLSWGIFLLFPLLNVIVLLPQNKFINKIYNLCSQQTKLWESYSERFRLIETQSFQSEELRELTQQFKNAKFKASKVIEKLKKINSSFDQRANIFFIFIADPLFLWDLHCVLRLALWFDRYKTNFTEWIEALSSIDALNSLANYGHNHSTWCIPSLNDDNKFEIRADYLGHPLIPEEKRISNSFDLYENQLVLITGANMAGKSTFLRTIGINMILAMCGCRVCAEKLSLTPRRLFSNMRTTDNLQKEESYFFAELKRLQQMLDELKQGHPHFLLIDEMLKGTNSRDKLIGSQALVRQLIKLKANGIIATHDLKLTDLAKDYPNHILNKYFDIQLDENHLVFDYKLKDGVTNTMNASFLMKKMGIIE